MSSLTLWAWLALAAVPSPRTRVVSGTVVDPQGKPVKGATVWLTAFVDNNVDVANLAQVETDAEGRFTVDAPTGGGDRFRFLSLRRCDAFAFISRASSLSIPRRA
jgi:Carboxypeptidase regulatory-like domain